MPERVAIEARARHAAPPSEPEAGAMKKRKQHYVWEHYLQAWTIDDKIWCQMGDRRFNTSTENVCAGARLLQTQRSLGG